MISYYRKYLVSALVALAFCCMSSIRAQITLSINPTNIAKFTALGALSLLAAKKSFETGCDYFILKEAAKRSRKAYASDASNLFRAALINTEANVSGALSVLGGIVAVKALLGAKNCVV